MDYSAYPVDVLERMLRIYGSTLTPSERTELELAIHLKKTKRAIAVSLIGVGICILAWYVLRSNFMTQFY